MLLTIRDETSSGSITNQLTLNLLDEKITVRELIRSRVYQEVDDFNRRLRQANATATLRAPVIPDGRYSVTINAGAVASNGVPSTQTQSFEFFVLTGDLNRDGEVGFTDLLTVAQNYGQYGMTFSQGNVDYSPDGLIDFVDLLTVAQLYGNTAILGSDELPRAIGQQRRGIALDVL